MGGMCFQSRQSPGLRTISVSHVTQFASSRARTESVLGEAAVLFSGAKSFLFIRHSYDMALAAFGFSRGTTGTVAQSVCCWIPAL